MPRSQPHGHRRGRAWAPTLPCRRARGCFRDEVALKFLLENSPRAWACQWNPAARTISDRICVGLVMCLGEDGGTQNVPIWEHEPFGGPG
jgi:hypothetical protein